ncbi:hypothetical protein Tco_1273123 [Tanacetum coccineum]
MVSDKVDGLCVFQEFATVEFAKINIGEGTSNKGGNSGNGTQVVGTDNQEKDEKQRQNDKTGLGMEKTVKDKAKSKPESLEALGAIRTGFIGHSLRKSGLGSETTNSKVSDKVDGLCVFQEFATVKFAKINNGEGTSNKGGNSGNGTQVVGNVHNATIHHGGGITMHNIIKILMGN